MNAIKCSKCGGEISNDFGVTLSYCTNCGAGVKTPPSEQTLELPESTSPEPQKPPRLFPAILLTSFLTALFLISLFGIGLFFYFPQPIEKKSGVIPVQSASPGQPTPALTPRPNKASPVPVSEITGVELSEIYYGTGVKNFQPQANRIINNMTITSNQIRFSADGTAAKFSSKIEYDAAGTKKPERTTKYKGVIRPEQFVRLAQALVENDFLNEENSKEIISDSNGFTLKITYTGGEKRIATSNVGQDTPEAAAMLRAFRNLQNEVDWLEEK